MKHNKSLFKVKCRGYAQKEVEKYIADIQAKNESALVEQKERIAILKKQNEELSTQIATLKGREEQIKLTLLKATDTANELDEQIKRRYKAELERLQLFRAKWTSAYEELKERYHFSKDALNMESVAVQTELDLTKYLTQEFSLNRGNELNDMEAYFRSEVARLTNLQQSMQNGLKSEGKSVKAKLSYAEPIKNDELESEGAFSIEEALNPTDSLQELCKSLGI